LEKPLYCQEFDNLLNEKIGLSTRRAAVVKKTMLRKGLISKSDRERKKGAGQFIGLPADIEKINQDMKQGKLSMPQ